MKLKRVLSTVLSVSMLAGMASVNVTADEIPFTPADGEIKKYDYLDYDVCDVREGELYMVFNKTSNVVSANNFAKEVGGKLVVINSAEENDFVLKLINSVEGKDKRCSYYIGATDRAKEGVWTDFDGNPLTYFNWDTGEPNNEGPNREKEDFVTIFSDKTTNNRTSGKCNPGKWNDNSGGETDGYSENVGFIVEVDLEEILFSRSYEYDGHTYLVCDNELAWCVVQALCESNDFYPASINSKEENDFINAMIKRGDQDLYVTGGIKDNKDVAWEDGTEADYTNFAKGEQNKKDKNIAIDVNDGTWKVINGTNSNEGIGYIFEMDYSVKENCKHEHITDGICDDCGYIVSIEIEDIHKPEPGEKFDSNITTNSEADEIIKKEIKWYELDENGALREIEEGETAVEGNKYVYETSISLDENEVSPFWWDANTVVVIEGETKKIDENNGFTGKMGFTCEYGGGNSSNFDPDITPLPTVPPTKEPTPTTKPVEPTPAPKLNVGDFVTRCYRVALEREPDDEGYDYWCDNLNEGKACGAQVGYGFIFSSEYVNKNKSNEDYVTDLYSMFFDREGDAAGYAYWVDMLNSGATREAVFAGFANSVEFYNLCNDYSVVAGYYLVGVPNDQQGGVNCFVARLYRVCLDRLPDMEGQAYWVMRLMNGEITGSSCAYGFVFSTEFANMNLSDEDYILHMYRAFFGREGEAEGVDYWVNRLNNGVSKSDIFVGFAASQEFANLCESYGILL